jgi:hypothetical protein
VKQQNRENGGARSRWREETKKFKKRNKASAKNREQSHEGKEGISRRWREKNIETRRKKNELMTFVYCRDKKIKSADEGEVMERDKPEGKKEK